MTQPMDMVGGLGGERQSEKKAFLVFHVSSPFPGPLQAELMPFQVSSSCLGCRKGSGYPRIFCSLAFLFVKCIVLKAESFHLCRYSARSW